MPKYTSFTNSKGIKRKINSINFSTKEPIIMGVLNITDNSFYDGGRYTENKNIISQTKKMLDEGASIIDIGAQSSRPGAEPIDTQTEINTLLPIIILLKNKFPNIIISIDTYRAKVIEECVKKGADIINDISAGEIDSNMLDTVAKLNIPYILMHMQGTPENMQAKPNYNNVTYDLLTFFKEKISILQEKGIQDIIIDPGFGFGKNLQHNYELLQNLDSFHKFGLPILVGASRKSMIYNVLKNKPSDALNGTTIINTIALMKGANILRVHDVKEAKECIKITTFAKNSFQ